MVPGEDWLTMDIKNGVGHKIGSALIPTASVADDAEGVNIRVDDTVPLYEGVTVAADQKAKTYEITATGLKSGVLPTPVKIELEVGTGLSGVKLYHYTDEMNVSYNPATGNIIFEVTSLSPFTVNYSQLLGGTGPFLMRFQASTAFRNALAWLYLGSGASFGPRSLKFPHDLEKED